MPGVPSASLALPRIEPDAFNARFFHFFAWYIARLLRKNFHAVRIVRGTSQHLAAAEGLNAPVIAALSHSSWWDPLLSVYLSDRFTPSRRALAPIDATQLAKFRFMRKLGVFGLTPDDPRTLEPMLAHVESRCGSDSKTTFWITPQGRFVDVRDEIRLRPGAAAAASRLSASHQGNTPVAVVCLAIEFAFWVDKRPEVFLRLEPCFAETPTSTASWHRALTRTMQRNGTALSQLVRSRDPAPFECLEGGDLPRINPVYDLLLSLRGARRGLDDRTPHHDNSESPLHNTPRERAS